MKLGYVGQEINIVDPDGFQIIPFKISKTNRTASGRLVEDIIAIKNNYVLRYIALDPEDINNFIQLFKDGNTLNFIYEDSGQEKIVRVNLNEMPRELFIYDWRYSKDITLTLEEV